MKPYQSTPILRNSLGPSCVFTKVTNPRSQVMRRAIYEKKLIRKGASIGVNTIILCGFTLGCNCFIVAGAVVTREYVFCYIENPN